MAIRQTTTPQTGSQGSPVDEIRDKAERGDSKAQYNLGLMHYGGHFMVQDDIEAYKWFTLAAERNEKSARTYRDAMTARMTPEQITEAKKRVVEFVPKKEASE